MLRRLWPRWRAATPILPTNRLLLTRRFRASPPRLTQTETPTVSQRLKLLVKSYGWYALGVYMVFSALDFSIAFIGVNLLGAEQVSQATAYLRQTVTGLWRTPSEPGREESTPAGSGNHDGLYAMLALAYTIHKTLFLPVRVGLTAALTPRIVGWLRARGWAGARRAVKEESKGPR